MRGFKKVDEEDEDVITAENITKEYDMSIAPFSWDKLDGLLAHKSSLVMCSDILDCPSSTIKDHINRRFNMSFTEYADKKISKTKLRLVQKALEMAMAGNVVMTIFCLKNINKWQDKFEVEEKNTEDSRVVQISYKVMNPKEIE